DRAARVQRDMLEESHGRLFEREVRREVLHVLMDPPVRAAPSLRPCALAAVALVSAACTGTAPPAAPSEGRDREAAVARNEIAGDAPPGAFADDDMVQVPAGRFVRGHTPAKRDDESPPHTVEMSAFSIDRTLVTRAAFARFVQATGYVTTAEQSGYGMGSREGMADWEWHRIPHASW